MKYHLPFLVIFVILFSFSASAQTYEKYSWEKDRKMTVLSAAEASQPELNILNHVQFEYVYDNAGSPVLYATRHEIIKVNNDEALASNNRIYIPMKEVLELTAVRARTINPDGSVLEIRQEDIKEIEDEETGAGYKIFAVDGAETGSEIEFYYTRKMGPDFFGREYFQFENPLKKASFKLISPANLEFEFKSYRGFSEVQKDIEVEGKNVYLAVAEDIPALKPEAFSAYNDNRQRIEFKLAYNRAQGNVKLFTWGDVGKNLYTGLHTLEKKEDKEIEKLLKAIKVDRYDNNFLKAAAIEDYVKTKFYIEDGASRNAADIQFISKNKFGSKYGITRLMFALLEKAQIPVELVLTSNRGDVKMDGEFESYNYLEDYLFYLPGEDKYIAPYFPQYRLEMAPPEFTANQGLFVKTMKIRDFIHPVAEVRYIAPAKASDNFDNMLISVGFNEDLNGNTVRMTRSFKGYQAFYIKAILPLLEEAKREELLKDLVKSISQDSDIAEVKFEKTDFDFRTFGDPLVMNSTFNTATFVDRAGSTLLFKVGELIGPQSELYQDDKRVLPVENEYNRSYYREIEVAIPEGYEIRNLSDMVIKEEAQNEKGETIFSFSSAYKLDGNVLKMEISEFYEEIYYPVDKFEDFRKVINAAADFNKIVLVMKKKG